MATPAGGFIWYELITTDLAAASAFYHDVVGWTIGAQATPPADGPDYRMIGRSDGGLAGGAMVLTADMQTNGGLPMWLGYLHVADVDTAAAAITAEGGTAHMPPMTMPDVGRITMVADPQGAPFYLMTPAPPADQPDAASDVFSVDQPQHVRWNELHTADPDAAAAFYVRHFGWAQKGEMDMGPLGKYRFVQHGGVGIGAIMPQMPGSSRSEWNFYFGVDDIDRAADAVGAGGGKLNGPLSEIPGGEFSVHCTDPQGVSFGLVGPRRN